MAIPVHDGQEGGDREESYAIDDGPAAVPFNKKRKKEEKEKKQFSETDLGALIVRCWGALYDPSARVVRVYYWTIGVTLLAFVAICWPLIAGSDGKEASEIFGGSEYPLAGTLIMVAGVTDLLYGDRMRHPYASGMLVLLSVLLLFLSLGIANRLESPGDPAGWEYGMASAFFLLDVLCGTYAVWLGGEGG
ncbi:hypothetical protein [Streptomyces griseosporeus]